MLAAALDQDFEVAAAQRPVDRVSVEVTIDGDRLPMGVTRQIVATFRVPEGQHLYSDPVPEGLVVAAIELYDIDGILSYKPLAPPTLPLAPPTLPLTPPTSPLTLAGFGDTLQVYERDVVLRLPVTQNARQMRKDDQ
ncbi:hypothetical protein [Candidatus Poriferisodalis sp.]|uniref:hypothetical protein n=1 Tax=Candidatus Poriferisodalis sp. TaxID=3101277 RepID=UPI003C701AF0